MKDVQGMQWHGVKVTHEVSTNVDTDTTVVKFKLMCDEWPYPVNYTVGLNGYLPFYDPEFMKSPEDLFS